MSNPFAALFEDVDRMSDPILADTDLSDPMFAPMEPVAVAPSPPPRARPNGAAPVPSAAPKSPPPPAAPRSAVHEMLVPPMPSKASRRRSIQAALVITWEVGTEPDLMELNDLLASGWRVATTAGFPAAGGTRSSLLVVVEQEMPS